MKRLTKKQLFIHLNAIFEKHPDESLNVKDIFRTVGANNHPAKMLTLDVLSDLVLDDQLTTDGRGNYRLARRSQVMEGTFHRRQNGRNAFEPDDGGKSILVAERNSLHAMDGDRVRATMLARRYGHAREAEVTEILERAKDTFVGTLQVEGNYGFLLTESRALAADIFIPKKYLHGGKNGEKAVVKIVEWPQDAKCPTGRVVDVLGKKGENDTEMHAILAEFDLPYCYPERVEEAARTIDAGITPEEIARREDFRGVLTFTIDPRDAKDFDDALSFRQLNKGRYEVGIHIADVTHYVHEGDIIDREGRQRATSIYLVDRTIPMLPERLSNFLCSLRPDEEKLAHSVIVEIDDQGHVYNRRIRHTVIRSDRRYAYEEVQKILEDPTTAEERDKKLVEPLLKLNELAKALREARFKSGAIDFDRPEVRFVTDEKGHPISTYLKRATDATRLIEEFMLLANRIVAESVGKRTFVYRIHDVPDLEKLEKLSAFVARLGRRVRTDGSKKEISRSLNKLLTDVHGTAEEKIVENVALRAMQKARYSTKNIGHYGLMFDSYTHFTSPIRRYPDMMVHRLLDRYAQQGARSANAQAYEERCEHCSNMEQLAEQAERASIRYKQVEFMADRLGQEFDGTINSITEFGFYVELDDNGCEGLVPLRDLEDDYYEFDERNICLVGRRQHHRYNLGQRVRIRVERADLDRRQLTFTLVNYKI